MAEEITISRQELYNLVWSKPVVQIAKDFGISDVAIAKICKKLNIPKPGLGYWAKKVNGKRTRTKALPLHNAGGLESYTIRKSVEPYFEPESEFIKKHREYETKAENKVIVKSTLRNSHPLVQASKAKLSNPNTDRYKRCYPGRGALNISVSKNSIHRALLIMDALIKALSKRGYETRITGEYDSVTVVSVDGEEFNFRIQESSKEIPANNLDDEDRLYSYGNMYDYIPTGKFTLQITNFYHGDKAVKDTKTKRLEEKLNSFILMLIKASEYEKNWRIERELERREDEARRMQEREIRNKREQEQQMVKELFDNAADWQKCVHVRDYIAAVQSHTLENSGEDMKSWIKWANQEVDKVESVLWNPNLSTLS
ncbi:MAG: hypothetical protein HOB84_03590 [Candidatus Marinimicrobia bacterium]|jgi:hypothetical protein|nr:hypothetical protein [Candidatus Neomarinimicrobiota bacterium]MBT4713836.1 hypothetical protein [Candidatus Neomarinimicrobiota bacterium]MBT4993741.1 hypothetical protein [Candidatus Neomarinimicrobiota bacterium]MBT5314518.1 hypothetical protein [Candidatus Neomarinimicrobiota bacterium]MBT6011549.1 hypothetical protein [Candidatus Neomarinimicrobiota bacterium]